MPSADVVDVLRDRHLLMLIDNCEHVQAAVRDIVARILRDCPGVTVLATSREPLRLAGEHVFVVAPMSAEDASGAAPAVTLFLDRAAAAGATIDDHRGQSHADRRPVHPARRAAARDRAGGGQDALARPR